MLRSMTGYGTVTKENETLAVKTEFKALNGKFLEINFRMPKLLYDKEILIRNKYQPLLVRGSVTISINLEFKQTERQHRSFNSAVINDYYKDLNQLAADLDAERDGLFKIAMTMPDIFDNEETELTEQEWQLVSDALDEAFTIFNDFRLQEGKGVRGSLHQCATLINGYVDEVEGFEEERKAGVKERLQANLEEAISKDKIDENRFEQELIYYLEKYDIAEEKQRLRHHCKYFLETLDEETSGKKLNFIAQEMGREINTMGAKANFFPMQQRVVIMKEELEKIKEQTMNVL